MKKDVRNLMFDEKPTFIIFKNYNQYSEFCTYAYHMISILGYISLYDVLNHIKEDGNFKKAYRYGWDYNAMHHSLVNAQNVKIKRKHTGNSWPICISLPPPIKIFDNKLYEKGEKI